MAPIVIDKNSHWYKTLRAASYVCVSLFLAQLITATTNDPMLFGPWTVAINAILVFVVNNIQSNAVVDSQNKQSGV